MKDKKDPISKHFSELGKKSWEARKKKLLAKGRKKKSPEVNLRTNEEVLRLSQ